MSRSRLLLALPTLLLIGCAAESPGAPTCAEGCAINQICVEGACVCDETSVDCAHDMSNGCEPAATCRCAYEGDASFCERQRASCGSLSGIDNCGNRRIVACGGACEEGLRCGAEERNTCGPGSCTPDSVGAICAGLGWECGKGQGTDTCGEVRDLECGPCPATFVCDFHRCVQGLRPYETCVAGGTRLGECGEGLACVGSPDHAVCVGICGDDEDCPGAQRCAKGYFEDGTGMCGTLRQQGETCEAPDRGPAFCWNPAGALTCIDGTCAFLCEVEGLGEAPCPDWMFCHEAWVETQTHGPVRLCI